MTPEALVRHIDLAEAGPEGDELRHTREWLVTNGLGGYASGTVAGGATRRYHGLLIAALPAPLGRVMMLNQVTESVHGRDGVVYTVGGAGAQAVRLGDFRLESGLPVWQYRVGEAVVEKRLVMPHRQNTVHLRYRLVSGAAAVRLVLRPALHFRVHEAAVSMEADQTYTFSVTGDRYEVRGPPALPTLRLFLVAENAAFTVDGRRIDEVMYTVESSQGYADRGSLWSPGEFHAELAVGREATLIGSTEDWNVMLTLSPDAARTAERERRRRLLAAAAPAARTGFAAELVLAADQFVITPNGRVEDAARARAAGDDVRTVIAGYHWFTDWGRDTMISLEGLTLATGRHLEAGFILRTFAQCVRDGLIPNLFPEGQNEGVYHTADATLWLFHALDRYLDTTGDVTTLGLVLPVLREIIGHHVRGTRFGIGVDPADGLLRQGFESLPLTWMDAKVGDWIVTPRRGKPVEINALWYNALRLLERWTRDTDGDAAAQPYGDLAAQVSRAFNARFWYKDGDYLYDLIDGDHGDDAACRPNQIFAVSLPHPVLDAARWERVIDVVRERLLTPVGLRSLAREHPDYKARYFGDLRARDAAYHQGTVWAWLIGPFVDAWLRVHPADRDGARRWLEGFEDHLSEACVGSVSEIFDAEPPFTPRGCVAQAWSVAEVLRAWLRCTTPAYQ